MTTRDDETIRETKQLLQEAQSKMIALSESCAQSRNWDVAERLMRWARSLDAIEQEMGGINGSGSQQPISVGQHGFGPTTLRLPYYYVDNTGMLVMRGKSEKRPEGYYEQRILKDHYDLIVRKLSRMAQSSNDFYNQDLIDRSEMPVHEPGLIIKLLSKKGLLQEIRKGRYIFLKPQDLLTDASRIWSELPRGRPGHSPSVNQKYEGKSVQATPKAPPKNLPRSYTGRHPISYTFSGATRRVRSFTDILVGVCEDMHQAHPSDFDGVLSQRNSRGKKYFSRDSKGMTRPHEISNSGIYAETNLSADDTMKQCASVLNLFGHSRDELTVQLEDE